MDEFNLIDSNPTPDEFGDVEPTANSAYLHAEAISEFGDIEKVPEEKSSTLSHFLSSAAIFAAFTALIVPSISTSDYSAEFLSLTASETSISYVVSIDNYSEGDELVIVVYNDFTRREQTVAGAMYKGEEVGLKPNMYYKVAVVDGNKTILEQTLWTLAEK